MVDPVGFFVIYIVNSLNVVYNVSMISKLLFKRCFLMIDIALLGCGGSMPIPNRYLSSVLMNYNGEKILVDCGEGTQVSMKILKWGFKTIGTICISHGHGDHIIGLPGLLATIGNSGRTEPMTIIGPEGITHIINGLRTVVPYLPYKINIIENPDGKLNIIKDMTIEVLKLDHSSPCIGYSFYIKRKPKFEPERAIKNEIPKNLWKILQDGETAIYNDKVYEPNMVLGKKRKGIKISYITDTRPIDAIPDFIRESDLFICEGSYGDKEDLEKAIKNKHMTFEEAAKLALRGNVKELLLTHFNPSMSEPELYKYNAESVFPNSIIGYDRLTRTLKFSEDD
jgi:ribonuclease Z